MENKIKELKEKIEKLNNENNNKKIEIEKKEEECLKIINNFLIKNLDFNKENFNNINFLYEQIQKNLKKNFVFFDIIYDIDESISKKNIESVKINADFLNWGYEEMEKSNDNKKFIFHAKLFKGHSYHFCFYIKGDKKLSEKYEVKRLKKKNNLKFNYIEIKDENGNVINDDDDDDDDDEESESNEEDNDEEEEEDLFNINENKEFLDNYFKFINLVFKENKNFTEIKKNLERKIRVYDEYLIKLSNKNHNKDQILYKEIKKFLYRIIKKDNEYFLIEDIDVYKSIFKVLPLYDQNSIKIDIKENEKYRNFLKFDIKDFYYKYEILNFSEGQKILKEFKNDKNGILIIKYNTIRESNNSYTVIPIKCFPENINLSEYDIKVDNKIITKITNKKYNYLMCFKSKYEGEIDDIKLMNEELKVYTTMYDKNTINILHFHLNDTSEDITIEANYLENEEKILNYKFSFEDSNGRLLTYRLIFQSRKLQKIYYFQNQNIIEPDFKEIRFTPDSIVKVLEGKYKNYHGKINSFPNGYLCRKTNDTSNNSKPKDLSDFANYIKVEECKERSLAELFGFIPIDLMYKTDNKNENVEELDKTIHILIQCCKLYPLSNEEQPKFEKKILINKQNQINNEIMKINDAFNLCKNYEKYVNDSNLIDELNFNQCQKIFDDLNEIKENNFNDENNECENEIKFIKNIKENIIILVQRRLRILKLNIK